MGQGRGTDPSLWNDLWEGRWEGGWLTQQGRMQPNLALRGSYWQFILVSGFETAGQSQLLTVWVAVC